MTDATANLATRYLGLQLPSPIVVGSSGLTATSEGVRACAEAGAGAVVLKSLFEEQIAAEVGRIQAESEHPYYHPEAAEYIAAYGTENAVSEYLRLIETAKGAVAIPVIASISCATPKGWVKFARQIEAAGADALELNVFVPPAVRDRTGAQNEKVYFDVLAAVRKQVSLPIAMKLGPYFSSISDTVTRLCARGAAGVVLFNRFYAPDLDIENFQVVAGPALSAPEEMHLTLRTVAQLAGTFEGDLAASTGIHDGAAVVKQLLAGATVVQVASALYRHQVGYLATMHADLRGWMARKHFASVGAFRAKMKQQGWPDGEAYDRVQFMKRSLEAERI
ncbi:MAG TPA: dihydroorotate dehydrogenase-like protein [Candidatus Krumholzibacteria bacterium]|nr:dihydroorotate dehydrogenase-like protein [Candidatus Krumholzibacteria bacterium]HPD70251.1 dihydroorotate dehydrogenase-like protein [Candidatus Krumholzibacteria bacterium]HRY40049.1 dihydroorotate dehydrogenase-like protein [Candidatus Krumholzibacteria bacterium]